MSFSAMVGVNRDVERTGRNRQAVPGRVGRDDYSLEFQVFTVIEVFPELDFAVRYIIFVRIGDDDLETWGCPCRSNYSLRNHREGSSDHDPDSEAQDDDALDIHGGSPLGAGEKANERDSSNYITFALSVRTTDFASINKRSSINKSDGVPKYSQLEPPLRVDGRLASGLLPRCSVSHYHRS